jgi:hypothetical protein
MNQVQMNSGRRKISLNYVEINIRVTKRVLKLFSNSDINSLEIWIN